MTSIVTIQTNDEDVKHNNNKNNNEDEKINTKINALINIHTLIENAIKKNTIGNYNILLEYLINNPTKTREITRIDLPKVSETDFAYDEIFQKIQGYVAINAILKYEENGELKSLRGLHKRNLGDLGIEIVSNFIINDNNNNTNVKQYLKTFGCAKNNIGALGARLLSKALTSNSPRAKAITSVEVYCNEKGQFWGNFAGDILLKNPSITNVDLGGNEIGDIGICAMLANVNKWQNVTKLTFHLDYCNITDVGAVMLRNQLPHANIYFQGNPQISKENLKLSCPLPDPWSIDLIHDNLIEYATLLKENMLSLQHVASFSNSLKSKNILRHSSDMPSFPDAIARFTLETCISENNKFLKGIIGQWVVSSLVIEDVPSKTCCILSWGMGTRFLNKEIVEALEYDQDDTSYYLMKDSHAEVLTRRGFKKYLLGHLFAFGVNATRSRDDIKFHLYTSTAPCTASKGHTECCENKIKKWISDGIQGKELLEIVGKIELNSIIIGRKYKKKLINIYAPCKVLQTKVRLQDYLKKPGKGTRGDTDESRCSYLGLNIGDKCIHDGRTGMNLNGTMSPLSSYVIKNEIKELYRRLGLI